MHQTSLLSEIAVGKVIHVQTVPVTPQGAGTVAAEGNAVEPGSMA